MRSITVSADGCMGRARGPWARAVWVGLALWGMGGAIGCSPDGLLRSDALPPDVPDPATVETPAGALKAYRGALIAFKDAFGGDGLTFVGMAGLLSDELQSAELGLVGSGGVGGMMAVDSRTLPEYAEPNPGETNAAITPYGLLQYARGQARQARGLLTHFAADSAALVGHLYAVEGYADLLLADLYCSGIPLSTLDYGGDYTLEAGSTTPEVYARAVALFDSALSLAGDSARIVNLARVGKARALLALGDYAGAAAAVSAVSDNFRYALSYSADASPGEASNRSFAYDAFGSGRQMTVADTEGGHGLPYQSSGDPRSAWEANGSNSYGRALYRPTKYEADGSSPIVLADGVEARLIEAEAALQVGAASWLDKLNALRTDGTFDTQPDPNDAAVTDTLWHAGTGGVAGLRPLDDPGTPDARVDLLFRERALWLYLTGHRQGDLRRLVREYDRDPSAIYPIGAYPGAGGAYGGDITIPIPAEERVTNPHFTGCLNRGA